MKGLPRLARFLPKVVLALLVSVSAEGYKKLAIWLNDMGMPARGGPAALGRKVPTGLQAPHFQGAWATSSLTPLAPRELPAGERL